MPGLTLFPVEAYYIQSQTSVVPKNSKKHCCFLEKNLCLIYEARPLVCRTQGFPLLYKSLDEKSFELSHCELCFTKWKGEFLSQNVLNMENLNTMLSVVNMEFLKAMGKFDELKSKRFMMFEIEKIK
jgi:Fe-S-cluster containining protein